LLLGQVGGRQWSGRRKWLFKHTAVIRWAKGKENEGNSLKEVKNVDRFRHAGL